VCTRTVRSGAAKKTVSTYSNDLTHHDENRKNLYNNDNTHNADRWDLKA